MTTSKAIRLNPDHEDLMPLVVGKLLSSVYNTECNSRLKSFDLNVGISGHKALEML